MQKGLGAWWDHQAAAARQGRAGQQGTSLSSQGDGGWHAVGGWDRCGVALGVCVVARACVWASPRRGRLILFAGQRTAQGRAYVPWARRGLWCVEGGGGECGRGGGGGWAKEERGWA